VRTTFRNEQAYLSDFMHRKGKLANTGLRAWCPSFKYHGIPAGPPTTGSPLSYRQAPAS
jgi:hypothetical protein